MTRPTETQNRPGQHYLSEERLRVGLTGGIASGKTTVSNQLGELGAGIIDTDEIARDVVAPGTPGLAALITSFGQEILLGDGTLDRAALRQRVFRNPQDKSRLEALLHPLIRESALDKAAATPGEYLVFVVPLLLETDFVDLVDRILVVDCPRALQQRRLMRRDNESAEAAARLIASQIERSRRLARADDVIVNDGGLDELRSAVAAQHESYLELARTMADSRNEAE